MNMIKVIYFKSNATRRLCVYILCMCVCMCVCMHVCCMLSNVQHIVVYICAHAHCWHLYCTSLIIGLILVCVYIYIPKTSLAMMNVSSEVSVFLFLNLSFSGCVLSSFCIFLCAVSAFSLNLSV